MCVLSFNCVYKFPIKSEYLKSCFITITHHQVIKPVNCKTNRSTQLSVTRLESADTVQKHAILAENLQDAMCPRIGNKNHILMM